MQGLPNELKEKILLEASLPELSSLCSTSRSFYNFCSDPSFWRRKFRQARLPLPLHLPKTPGGWIREFKGAEEAMELTLTALHDLEEYDLTIRLSPVDSIQFLNLPKIDFNFIYRVWKEGIGRPEARLSKRGKNYSLDLNYEEGGEYYDRETVLTPLETEELLYLFFHTEPEDWKIVAFWGKRR